MWRKVWFFSLTILLSIGLFGCGTANDQLEDDQENGTTEEEVEETPEDDQKEPDESEETDEATEMELQTGSTETVTREVEGMDNEIEVTNYEIQPYGLVYQLDEEFGAPEVDDHEIIYTRQEGTYQITLKVIEDTELDQAVTDVQEEMKVDEFEKQGELEDIPAGENELTGKMQFFSDPDPVAGFYAYEMDEHVLLLTYEYPVEGGDGMGPLLESLRKSIELQ